MNMNSTAWIITIIAGVVLVAIGNINYPIAKDRESKQQKAELAWKLLEPELYDNMVRLCRMKIELNADLLRWEVFNTSAWQTVSDGGLLLGLAPGKLSDLLRGYSLINRASQLHAKLIDSTLGNSIGSAQGAQRSIQQALVSVLTDLESHLRSIIRNELLKKAEREAIEQHNAAKEVQRQWESALKGEIEKVEQHEKAGTETLKPETK